MDRSNYQPYQEEKHITMQASKKHFFLRRSPLAYVVVPLAFVLVSTALVFIVSHTMLAPYQARGLVLQHNGGRTARRFAGQCCHRHQRRYGG